MKAGPLSEVELARAIAAGKQLQAVFEKIQHERMQDMPVINTKLSVAAVGFHPWQDCYLGVLVTPWFMNLMLLPQTPGQWHDLPELGKTHHTFPSGQYSFITGQEEGVGKYQMCSLFSPMFEFADQTATLETAAIVLQELHNEAHVETPDIDSEQIENIWHGVEPKTEDIAAEVSSLSADEKQTVLQGPTLDEQVRQPISRRDLLRGVFTGAQADGDKSA